MKRGLKLNRVIKYLIYSDLIFYTGWGLISPIFAVFILDNIVGATTFVIGLSAGLNLVFRSLLRVPFGILTDKSKKIAYWLMFWGLLVFALIPLSYIFISLPWHLYLVQIIMGAAAAMTTAGWTGVFAKYMDRNHESTEWGIDAVAVGIGPGIAAAVGGAAVEFFSFSTVFIIVTVIGILGTMVLLAVRKEILDSPVKTKGPIFLKREVRRLKKQARI